jgi:hypothetical protein
MREENKELRANMDELKRLVRAVHERTATRMRYALG